MSASPGVYVIIIFVRVWISNRKYMPRGLLRPEIIFTTDRRRLEVHNRHNGGKYTDFLDDEYCLVQAHSNSISQVQEHVRSAIFIRNMTSHFRTSFRRQSKRCFTRICRSVFQDDCRHSPVSRVSSPNLNCCTGLPPPFLSISFLPFFSRWLSRSWKLKRLYLEFVTKLSRLGRGTPELTFLERGTWLSVC